MIHTLLAILDVRARYEAIGLSLAPTTESKNIIFGLDDGYTDQQKVDAAAADLHWLPSRDWRITGRQSALHVW